MSSTDVLHSAVSQQLERLALCYLYKLYHTNKQLHSNTVTLAIYTKMITIIMWKRYIQQRNYLNGHMVRRWSGQSKYSKQLHGLAALRQDTRHSGAWAAILISWSLTGCRCNMSCCQGSNWLCQNYPKLVWCCPLQTERRSNSELNSTDKCCSVQSLYC